MPTKIDVKLAMDASNRLSCLKFYPSHPAGIAEIAATIHDLASDDRQVDWLIHTLKSRYDEWPGPKTLRAVFCERFKPADGIEAVSQ
jgi:hypothetical protein